MNKETTQEAKTVSTNQVELPKPTQMKKKGSSQSVFMLIFVYGLSIAMLHSFFKSMIDFRRDAAQHNVHVRELKDLFYVLLSAVGCVALRHGFDLLFKQGIIDRVHAQGLSDAEYRIEKSLKQGKDIMYYGLVSVSRSRYFLTVQILGVYVSWNKEQVPSILGGAGTCGTVEQKWPNINHDSAIRVYQIVQFGHHLQSKLPQGTCLNPRPRHPSGHNEGKPKLPHDEHPPLRDYHLHPALLSHQLRGIRCARAYII